MRNRLECMQPIRFLVVLLMCCLSYTTWAQTQSNVNGLVTDFSGEPLIGVSILVKVLPMELLLIWMANFLCLLKWETCSR